MFARLRDADEGAFVPYLTLGDPSPADTVELASCAVDAGADAVELGIPFSDPIADGPAIQASTQRALAAGTSPGTALELAAEIRANHPHLPLGLLVYSNLAVHAGLESFLHRVSDTGCDSVLFADVPALEAESFHRAAARTDLDFVMIVPPNASEETVRTAADRTSGYVYVVTRDGPTGAEREAASSDHPHLEQLDQLGAPPALVGFGVSEPRHIREALASGAAGAISGSAVARRIEAHLDDRDEMFESVAAFVSEMKRAAASPTTAAEEETS